MSNFEDLIKDVRQWVRAVAIPHEDQVEAEDNVPDHIVEDMKKHGFFSWGIPREYGGSGLNTEELVTAAMEISQCSVAFRARVGGNAGIASEGLVIDGTHEQKAKYLPRLASGEITGCFALTEKTAGSEATALKTTAIRDGDKYIINGEKCLITNAPLASLFTVIARTNPDDLTHKGLSAFLIDLDSKGLSVGNAYKMMGQRGSPVSEVYFKDVVVPVANLIGGQESFGFKTAMKALNKQRLHLAALCVGPAIRMLEEAIKHTTTREQFGQPAANFQLVQAMIADCQTEISAAKALILETARKRDRGEDVVMEASMCKYYASEMCGRVADRAVQMFGGSGYIADYSSIERMYRDVRLFRFYEGTSQIHQLNIARLTLNKHNQAS